MGVWTSMRSGHGHMPTCRCGHVLISRCDCVNKWVWPGGNKWVQSCVK